MHSQVLDTLLDWGGLRLRTDDGQTWSLVAGKKILKNTDTQNASNQQE